MGVLREVNLSIKGLRQDSGEGRDRKNRGIVVSEGTIGTLGRTRVVARNRWHRQDRCEGMDRQDKAVRREGIIGRIGV